MIKLLVLLLLPVATAYWQRECGGDPAGGWILDDHERDCALRKVGLSFAAKVLHGRGQPAVHRALNLDICGVAAPQPAAPPPTTRAAALARHGAAGATELFVAASDTADPPAAGVAATDGSASRPFRSVHAARDAIRALPAAHRRRPAVVWLRGGVHYVSETLVLDAEGGDGGASAAARIIYASHPNERAVLSGGEPLPANLQWSPVAAGEAAGTFAPLNGATVYKAKLPKFGFIKGLFDLKSSSGAKTERGGAGKRLTRARYPNCADITGSGCYTLNASAATGNPSSMIVDGAHNIVVQNQHGAWTTNGSRSNASGGAGVLIVEHPDYAWRCPADCGWVAYSQHRAEICGSPDKLNGCRFDATHNVPYWEQQVSGGFHFNHTAQAQPWAPAWTEKTWAKFECNLLDPTTGAVTSKGVACPKGGPSKAVVIGGWQEGRGAAIGAQYTAHEFNNSYFVENIKEELDAENEWFYDEVEETIYLIPTAGRRPQDMQLVASKLARVLQFNGTVQKPIMHVGLHNVTVAHSAYTYMEQYEIPSGGDWSIHRGASVFMDGAESISVDGCDFDQIDGNGIFLSRYVRNCSLARNDFKAIGDSAILVVGAAGAGRIDNSKNKQYPAYNVIEENHVDGVGVWVKQTAAYFKAVTRDNTIKNNVFHDSPRSLVNYNDGFAGGEQLTSNLLLNSVMESNDHGPFNSWDRQPYVTRIDEADMQSKLQISPQTSTIANNLIFNANFHGQSCGSIAVDFDDETSQMNVTANVLVYGAVKTFDGMDRSISENLILFAGGTAQHQATPCCLAALQSSRNLSSAHTHFWTQSIYRCGAGPGPFTNASYHVDTRSNHYLFPGLSTLPNVLNGCDGCFKKCPINGSLPTSAFKQWQALGHDVDSDLSLDFDSATMIAAANARLGI